MTAVLTPPSTAHRPAVRAGAAGPATLVGLEVRKSLSTRSGRSLAVAAALLPPAGAALASAVSEDPLLAVASPLAMMGMLTALVLLALGVLSTAGEWTHRTVQTTFLLTPQRGRVLAAKAASVALLGAGLAAVSAATSAAVLAVFEPTAAWDGVGRVLAVAVVSGAAFAVTGAGIGAAVANAPAALTGTYLVVLGVLPVVQAFRPEITERLDPTAAVLRLAETGSGATPALVLTGWVVVATVAGAVVTRRRAVA
ncbi:hypothetical protein [Geodermatophilus marinus]|uniref:hypothetical protein n=1 Tax=Geodermatophilus sp. LHW52908 TaxID=2303986 RepID=UPI00131465CD|nr:hypothetical protein [Geodermatophilus sp. LHW52908]